MGDRLTCANVLQSAGTLCEVRSSSVISAGLDAPVSPFV
jgi:hypothetical protein